MVRGFLHLLGMRFVQIAGEGIKLFLKVESLSFISRKCHIGLKTTFLKDPFAKFESSNML